MDRNDAVRKMVNNSNLTSFEIIRRANISRRTLKQIVEGSYNPTDEEYRAIASAVTRSGIDQKETGIIFQGGDLIMGKEFTHKYIVLGSDEPVETQFEYEIGEIINVNSTGKAMCIKKEEKDGELYQYFREGKCTWSFD